MLYSQITVEPDGDGSYAVRCDGDFAYDAETIEEAFRKAIETAKANGIFYITYKLEP